MSQNITSATANNLNNVSKGARGVTEVSHSIKRRAGDSFSSGGEKAWPHSTHGCGYKCWFNTLSQREGGGRKDWREREDEERREG